MTLCQLHNESMNVYSHLLPAIYFAAHLLMNLISVAPYQGFTHWQTRAIIALGAVCILTCMTASTCYHLYMPMSAGVYQRLFTCDLVGIGVMIFGLTVVACWLGFHNYPGERMVVVICVGLLAVMHLLIQMTPCYTDERYSKHRVVLYGSILCGCLGLAFWARFYIGTSEEIEEFFPKLILSYVWLLVGFIFYATSFPERTF